MSRCEKHTTSPLKSAQQIVRHCTDIDVLKGTDLSGFPMLFLNDGTGDGRFTEMVDSVISTSGAAQDGNTFLIDLDGDGGDGLREPTRLSHRLPLSA